MMMMGPLKTNIPIEYHLTFLVHRQFSVLLQKYFRGTWCFPQEDDYLASYQIHIENNSLPIFFCRPPTAWILKYFTLVFFCLPRAAFLEVEEPVVYRCVALPLHLRIFSKDTAETCV